MKYSTKLSDAAHILAFIALHLDCDLTSDKIAESVKPTRPMCASSCPPCGKGGLLTSVKGHPRPALAKSPAKSACWISTARWRGINLCFTRTPIPTPPAAWGVNIQLALRDCYDLVQARAEEAMDGITLQEVLDRYEKKRNRIC